MVSIFGFNLVGSMGFHPKEICLAPEICPVAHSLGSRISNTTTSSLFFNLLSTSSVFCSLNEIFWIFATPLLFIESESQTIF